MAPPTLLVAFRSSPSFACGYLVNGMEFEDGDRVSAGRRDRPLRRRMAGMNVGGTRLIIPSTLGYGGVATSTPHPPNSTLVFRVKLSSCQ